MGIQVVAKYRCTKTNNYGAKKTVITFNGKRLLIDSKLEATHATELIRLNKAGKISNLVFQPQFELLEGFMIFSSKVKSGKSKQSSVSYTPDFSYIDEFGRHTIVESKGFETPLYKLRRRIFLYLMKDLGVDIFIERFARHEIVYKPYTKE